METLVLHDADGRAATDVLFSTQPTGSTTAIAVDDDAVLAAALALIDDVCATRARERARCVRARRRRAAERHNELAQLNAQVDKLQQALDATRERLGLKEIAHDDLARLWARVALSQRKQRARAEAEHAALERTARHHRELAARVAAFVHGFKAALAQLTPRMELMVHARDAWAVPPQLLHQLDVLCELRSSPAIPPTANAVPYDDEVRWDVATLSITFRFRAQARLPFKLSMVANAMWHLMQEHELPVERLAHDEIYNAHVHVRKPKAFGLIEFAGPSALRRTYVPDGGVLLTAVAMRTGTAREGNLMAGLEIHERVWIRVTRATSTSTASPVLVETMSEVHVVALAGLSDDDAMARLQRLEVFMVRTADEDRGAGQQELENHLLDTAIARRSRA